MSKYPNSGALNRNERKTEPKHPDYKGQASIGTQDFWISAWVKDGPNGKFLSLSFQPKEERPANPAPVARDLSDAERVSAVKRGVQQHFGGPDLSDDIPF